MRSSCRGVVDYIVAHYASVVEVGVGRFPDVALALVEKGVKVVATDIEPFVYRGLQVLVDDITEPGMAPYRGVDLVYAIRPPPELVPYMKDVAKAASADLIVKVLSAEFPTGGHMIGNGNTAFFLWRANDEKEKALVQEACG